MVFLLLRGAKLITPECSVMSCCVAQFLRFVRLIRTVVESIADGVCRNTGGSILTLESILVVTSPVAEVGIPLVRHVEAVRKAITEPVVHQTEQGVVTFDHIIIFAIIAKRWILIRPIVTIGCTIACEVYCIHTPWT